MDKPYLIFLNLSSNNLNVSNVLMRSLFT